MQNSHVVGAAVLFVVLGVAEPAPADQVHGPAPAGVSACFVPAQDCLGKIVAAIEGARFEIRVQAYGFTSTAILSALAATKARGADVQVILDKSDDPSAREDIGQDAGTLRWTTRRHGYSGANYMVNAGVPVWIDDLPAIAHNKLIMIDRRLVIGGSYNYTASAERRNAENVTFIDSPEVAEWFLANWMSRREASRPLRTEPTGSPAYARPAPRSSVPLAATACAPEAEATCGR